MLLEITLTRVCCASMPVAAICKAFISRSSSTRLGFLVQLLDHAPDALVLGIEHGPPALIGALGFDQIGELAHRVDVRAFEKALHDPAGEGWLRLDLGHEQAVRLAPQEARRQLADAQRTERDAIGRAEGAFGRQREADSSRRDKDRRAAV